MSAESTDWVVRVGRATMESGLSRDAISVMMAIEMFARNKPYCWPSNDELRKLSGLPSVRTLQRFINQLSDGDDPWIIRVCTKDDRTRIGFLLLKRTAPGLPVVDSQEDAEQFIKALSEASRTEYLTAILLPNHRLPRRSSTSELTQTLALTTPKPVTATHSDAVTTSELTQTSTSELTPVIRTNSEEEETQIHAGAREGAGEDTGGTWIDAETAESLRRLQDPVHQLLLALFPDRPAIADQYWAERNSFPSRIWRDAAWESWRRKPDVGHISYIRAIARNNPNGIKHHHKGTGPKPPPNVLSPEHEAFVQEQVAIMRAERQKQERERKIEYGQQGPLPALEAFNALIGKTGVTN